MWRSRAAVLFNMYMQLLIGGQLAAKLTQTTQINTGQQERKRCSLILHSVLEDAMGSRAQIC